MDHNSGESRESVLESVLVTWIMVNDAVCRCLSRGLQEEEEVVMEKLSKEDEEPSVGEEVVT